MAEDWEARTAETFRRAEENKLRAAGHWEHAADFWEREGRPELARWYRGRAARALERLERSLGPAADR